MNGEHSVSVYRTHETQTYATLSAVHGSAYDAISLNDCIVNKRLAI